MIARVLIIACVSLSVLADRSASQGREVLNAIVTADSVNLENRHVIENCASRFAVRADVNGQTITVLERDTIVEKMRCICEYTITTVLHDLPAGRYEAEFVREYLKRYGYASDTTVRIGSVSFVVTDDAAGSFALSKWQSDCFNAMVEPVQAASFEIAITPNPFRTSALVRFELEAASPVTVELYNALGSRIDRHEMEVMAGGSHHILLTADRFPSSGQYFCRVTTPRHGAVAAFCVLK